MSFTNPASAAKENAAAYVRSLMELLGDRDPFEVQAGLLDALRKEIAGVDDQTLRRPEKPGKWSVLQVIQHLADSELVFGYRLRMVLAHPTPEIQGYDQDLWANELKYNEMELEDALEQLRVIRAINLKLLRSLSEDQFERVGLHSERGPESVRKMMKMIAGHDLLHLRQIKRIKKAHGVQ